MNFGERACRTSIEIAVARHVPTVSVRQRRVWFGPLNQSIRVYDMALDGGVANEREVSNACFRSRPKCRNGKMRCSAASSPRRWVGASMYLKRWDRSSMSNMRRCCALCRMAMRDDHGVSGRACQGHRKGLEAFKSGILGFRRGRACRASRRLRTGHLTGKCGSDYCSIERCGFYTD